MVYETYAVLFSWGRGRQEKQKKKTDRRAEHQTEGNEDLQLGKLARWPKKHRIDVISINYVSKSFIR